MLITALAGWLAVRRRARRLAGSISLPRCRWCFPASVLGIAVMQVFLRMPIPLYGTLWIIADLGLRDPLSALWHALRYSGMLQIHRELEEAAGDLPAPRRSRAAPDRGAAAGAGAGGGLAVHLPDRRQASCRSPILLAGPGSQIMAVAMFDLWVNGQGSELAALGLMWTVLMTLIAVRVLSRRRGVGRRHAERAEGTDAC